MGAPIDLNLLRAFLRVHATRSFSMAAEGLGVPRSTVSRALSSLEGRLGVVLFTRTTRKVVPTPEGDALAEQLLPSLMAMERAVSEVPDRSEVPSGTLRITTVPDLGVTVLSDVVSRYLARYPGTRVELSFTDRLADLVGERFDLALRVARKPLRASTLVTRRVGDFVLRLYASPQYLAQQGTPHRVRDLASHRWVAMPGIEPLVKGAAPLDVRVSGDDMFFSRAALRSGCGIGALPSFLAKKDLASGTLIQVLPAWTLMRGSIFLLHPNRKHLPARVTAFQALLLESLRHTPLEA